MKQKVNDRLRDLLAFVNPFGLIVDGIYKNYPSVIDAYIDMMMKLYKWAPKGYVDIPLFMYEYQEIPLFDAVNLCRKRSEVVMINFLETTNEACDDLENLLRRLMEVTGVEFNPQCYLAARSRFIPMAVKAKANEEIEQLIKEQENGNKNNIA